MKYVMASATLMTLLLAGPGTPPARAQETVKKVPVRGTRATTGKDLYREFCAVCHGPAGKGDGPAASALKVAPSDLTQIAKRNGGAFPERKVQHIINGEEDQTAAHGSKEMPVWGNVFHHMDSNPDLGTVRVYNLVKYLQAMQAK